MPEEETQAHRDQRILNLWKTLDTAEEGQIDLHGLKKGLKKIDHPLKNADALLHDVLKVVDSSGDGQIQFNEFKVFIEHAERELFQLFDSIDRDHNGSLDKEELRQAFARSGIIVSNAKLDQFFDEMDTDHDGEISFEEWRCAVPGPLRYTVINITQKLPLIHSTWNSQPKSYLDILQLYSECHSRRRCPRQRHSTRTR